MRGFCRGTLDSYRKDACIFLGADLLAGRIQKDCIKGSLGILMPSSAYLMVCGGKGEKFTSWLIRKVVGASPPSRTSLRSRWA
jgi:hypothetical protein